MAQPLLLVVSGPPGSGTTTLAHELARAIPCPAICRDELKEGLVEPLADFVWSPGDELAYRTLDVFFEVLTLLVDRGVSLVAESSFQHGRWEPGLTPLVDKARVRVLHCEVDADIARDRIAWRAEENPSLVAVHGDPSLAHPTETFRARHERFARLDLPVPSLRVSTAEGYDPPLAEIVAFAKGA